MLKIRSKIVIPWIKRIFYPFFFLIILIFILTTLINKGQKHRRISKQIEDRILDLALYFSGPRETRTDTISYYSFNEGEDSWLKKRDLILKEINRRDFIFIFNLSKEDEIKKKLKELRQLAAKNKKQASIIITEQPERVISKKIKNKGKLVFIEDDLCEPQKQRICTYNPKWPKWFSQFAHEKFYTGSRRKNHITEEMQRIHPSYILYLDKNPLEENLSKILFIQLNKDTSKDKQERSVFWARVTRMIIDNDFIHVASKESSIKIQVVFMLLILYLILKFESIIQLIAIFLSYTIIILLNTITITYFRYYIPIWQLLYYSSILMIVVFFIKISYLSFKKNKELQNSEQKYERNDLQKTILSIMSHNLNTPLAQVQGLFDLIKVSINNKEYIHSSLPKLESDLSCNYLNIKIFLALTALNNKRFQLKTILFSDLIRFIRREYKLCLKRKPLELGIYYDKSLENSHLYCAPLLLVYSIVSCLYNFQRSSTVDLIISHSHKTNLEDIFIEMRSKDEISKSLRDYIDFGNIRPHSSKNLGSELSLLFLEQLKKRCFLMMLYTKKGTNHVLRVKISFLDLAKKGNSLC